jgi:lipid-A-disaccharide synthase
VPQPHTVDNANGDNVTEPENHQSPRIFFSAGEASGDLHAANLARAIGEIASSAEFAALGGAELAAAGADVIFDMTKNLAVMGITKVVAKLPEIFRVRRQALDFVDSWRPDAAVLIDYPGFNINIARHLKKRGIPVFYYICPQVWAWAPGRVKKIARRIDKALVVFEFEVDFFRKSGIDVTYVGHPLGDFFARRTLDREFIENGPLSTAASLVALVPGSRKSEIEKGFALKAAAAKLIKAELPETTFAAAVLTEEHAALVGKIAAENGLDCKVVVGKTHEVMSMARFALATSGTATLELAHFATPMIVLYRTGPIGIALKNVLLTIPHIALVNILAGREVVPEFVYWRRRPETIARAALDILTDKARYEEVTGEIAKVAAAINAPGASHNAAAEILKGIGRL